MKIFWHLAFVTMHRCSRAVTETKARPVRRDRMPGLPRTSSVVEAAYTPAVWDAPHQPKVTLWLATPKCHLREPRPEHIEPEQSTHRPSLASFLNSFLPCMRRKIAVSSDGPRSRSGLLWGQAFCSGLTLLAFPTQVVPGILPLEYGKGTVPGMEAS